MAYQKSIGDGLSQHMQAFVCLLFYRLYFAVRHPLRRTLQQYFAARLCPEYAGEHVTNYDTGS